MKAWIIKSKFTVNSGADITLLKEYYPNIMFFQYPYDSSHRSKKIKKEVAKPSASGWKHANINWNETNSTWEDLFRK